MECRKRLTPGMNGTKRYQNRFGERLLYVRYRLDHVHKRRVTTVELIVDEAPLPIPRSDAVKAMFTHPNQNVTVRIEYNETELRNKAKAAGARWLPDLKAWKMPYKLACDLGIGERVRNELSNNGKK